MWGAVPMDDRRYARVIRQVSDLINIDLERYEPRAMRQRLEAYFSLVEGRTAEDYLDSIRSDAVSLEALRSFITVSASTFFRDPELFEVLATQILPNLVRGKNRFTAWSAGCSSGAEPYSVAIVLEGVCPGLDYRILGTDVDGIMLARARGRGSYSPAELTNVSQQRLNQYFLPENGGYRVRPELRRRVTFRLHDLLRDEFEGGFDLILCRNVAIYLSEQAKNELVPRLVDALRPGGVLFVGATELIASAGAAGLEQIRGPFYRRTGAHRNGRAAMSFEAE